MTESRCEACGAAFGCEAGTGRECWCASVLLDDAGRAALATRFERCLCPACLEREASRAAGSRAAGTPARR